MDSEQASQRAATGPDGGRTRIAIIGTGISGLAAAYRLAPSHDVHLYEASDYVGGHTNTVDVEDRDGRHAIDTGFIVHNPLTYPALCQLFRELEVPVLDTAMSFGVRDERSGLEYASTGLRGLFADRRRAFDPAHLRMIAEILRWNRRAENALASLGDTTTLAEFVRSEGYSRRFVEAFIVPMGAAIWSTDAARMLEFPAASFVRFLMNHRMLEPVSQPTWRVVVGGSREYVKKITRGFADKIRLETAVLGIRRDASGVWVRDARGNTERFDHVIIATHSDQALRLLEDPSDAERSILGAISYQPNVAVLHTDVRVLPTRRAAWASWNYRVSADASAGVAVSYDMNALQHLATREQYIVSLNETAIDPKRVVREVHYMHPLFTTAAVRAQRRRSEICGHRGTHYAGAYWGYGFHEDGARSGLEVAARIGAAP